MTADGRRQIHKDIELLKLTGACDGQEARDGAFTVLAAIAKADLAPLHGVAQGPLRSSIGGVDPRHAHDRPQRRLDLQQFLARGGSLGTGTTSTTDPCLANHLAQPPFQGQGF